MADQERYLIREQQIKNTRKSKYLVASLVVFMYVLCLALGFIWTEHLLFSAVFAVLATGILVPLQFWGSKTLIIKAVDGQRIAPATDDEKERLALLQVEGIAIAAGLTQTPELYIIETDIANAFAGGMDAEHAYIVVTRGLLDILEAEELEGVLAHEIAHILNLDVKLNTVIIGVIGSISIIASLLLRSGGSKSSRDDNKVGGAIVAVVAIAFVLALLSDVIAKWIQRRISREREYLADATAVRLVGYNEGLARALEKLADAPAYSKEDQAELGGDRMSALYIHYPEKKRRDPFATHPPIEERVKILRNMY